MHHKELLRQFLVRSKRVRRMSLPTGANSCKRQSITTIEREALAVVAAVKEFYPYLYGFHFTLVTDHNPLTSLKGLHDVHGY